MTPLFNARCKACWVVLGLILLVILSFTSLDLQWHQLASTSALSTMGRFLGELLHPNLQWGFLKKVLWAACETLAMSALGTVLAAVFGMVWAIPASRQQGQGLRLLKGPSRAVLNGLRSIPELVWASLLLIALGLGPFAGTMALALHTTGVLGRLFAESIENAPDGPALALRLRGIGATQVFWYATFPQIIPQVISYTLYRWENNIRAAAILGVVGAGGLGQLLSFHLSLFQMAETSTVLLAMIVLVAVVDGVSYLSRVAMSR